MPHPGYVVFPAGPIDAEALSRVHVQAWRETYKGLLSDAFLARMSEPGSSVASAAISPTRAR